MGDISMLEHFDGYASLRNTLRHIAHDRDEYAGIPMPLDDAQLVIEPTYSFAAGLGKRFGADAECQAEDKEEAKLTLRNRFWSDRRSGDVVIFQDAEGRIDWGIESGIHHFTHDLKTLGCADAWGIEQEHNAVQLLGTLVSHRKMKQYLLTGMFLERSKRSGVTYCFRKLRPTVAIRSKAGRGPEILACLCMHPIAYYSGSSPCACSRARQPAR